MSSESILNVSISAEIQPFSSSVKMCYTRRVGFAILGSKLKFLLCHFRIYGLLLSILILISSSVKSVAYLRAY